ncbi:MAG TPA: prolyl-tRNA synthetase associated domain-containing protein [Beijerinckiaceae bacterium]|nr:prolyl-tRNA synthetase associated domain-containing protein [Beijerinckiaceae bacterium]
MDRLAIAHRTLQHVAVYTVAESRELRGTIPGAHSKNLFLKDKKGRLFLVTALEDAPLNLKKLHEAIGGQGRVSFGSAEQLRACLGVEPGSVTPFAAMNDTDGRVTVVLQRKLAEAPVLNFHPLTNTATTTITNQDLLQFLAAIGHPPHIVDLPEGEASSPEA